MMYHYEEKLGFYQGENFEEKIIQLIRTNSPKILLTDEQVYASCHQLMPKAFMDSLDTLIMIESGESSKSLENAQNIWNHLVENHFPKSSMILAFGGGVVTDLAGFVSSNYKRGIPLVHIPTSFIGMIDASIGGKNGVNIKGHKNQVGNFYFPREIILNPSFLETLLEVDLRCGWAEHLKHLIIVGEPSWVELINEWSNQKKVRRPNREELERSIHIKMNLVREDTYDQNNRKYLNFGHTIGHALEAFSFESTEHPIPHGFAIAYGMIIESWISVLESGLERRVHNDLRKGIESMFGQIPLELLDLDLLIPFLKSDKKNRDKNKIDMVLLETLGKPDLTNSMDIAKLRSLFQVFMEEYKKGPV
jgi:3-dehydroquinate synthase